MVSSFLAIRNNGATNIFVQSFVWIRFISLLLGVYLVVALLGHGVTLVYREPSDFVPEWLPHFTVPPAVCKGSRFATCSSALVTVCPLVISHPSECEEGSPFDLHLGLTCLTQSLAAACVPNAWHHVATCYVGIQISLRI